VEEEIQRAEHEQGDGVMIGGKEGVWWGEKFRDSIINHKGVEGRTILNRI
jgi:hypothetical protein